MRRTAIIRVGNLLLEDEGLGLHVVQAMKKMSLKVDDERAIIDGGTCPDILYLLPEVIDKLIVVDATSGGVSQERFTGLPQRT